MPTHDRQLALTPEAASRRVGERAFTATAGPKATGVGLEPEQLVVRPAALGSARGRPRLDGDDGVVAVIDALAVASPALLERAGGGAKGAPHFDLANGGRLTFEPGAQVEHSTAVHPSVRSALDDVAALELRLQGAFRAAGAVLAAVGLDPWHDVADVPQQFAAGRYVAQAAYYERRGPAGRLMMRHTCSLQVNLDLGPEPVLRERYLAANLLSPLLTATFASSPGPAAVSTRAQVWQGLDPTRTGFPSGLAEPGRDPRAVYAEAVLAADVMLFRTADGAFHPGLPCFSFATWMRDGHELGWPTLDDLDYHLSTVFFEVRPRGFLELRAGEAVPAPLRAAPVVLLSAALYDERARGDILDALLPHRHRLAELWRRAAERGLRDAEIAGLAARVWAAAVAGAERLPVSFVGAAHLAATQRFLDRYVGAGRMPADDVAERLATSPAAALEWASAGWSRR